jgi:aryl-alcohol dehydrogenase-like predicted oxidoreductase
MSKNRAFKGDDLRKADPKFQGERFDQYLAAAEKIQKMADNQYGKDLLSTAIRWVLDQGIEIAIWGARTPEQLKPVDDIIGWSLNEADKSIIDDILAKTIKNPVGPEFMAPPERDINK